MGETCTWRHQWSGWIPGPFNPERVMEITGLPIAPKESKLYDQMLESVRFCQRCGQMSRRYTPDGH